MIKAHNETHISVFYIFISDFVILLFNYMNVTDSSLYEVI